MVRTFVLALVLIAATASARVIMVPTIPRMCPGGDGWQSVSTCLSKHGKLAVVRQLAGAKLVDLRRTHGQRGLYIYADRGKKWRISGMLELDGDFELLDFRAVTLRGHDGYRFDVGVLEPTDATLDGQTTVPAVLQQKLAVFCSGDSYHCGSVMSSCDVIIRGKSYWSFRGKLKYEGSDVIVAGDRSNAGTICNQDERVQLFWEQDP